MCACYSLGCVYRCVCVCEDGSSTSTGQVVVLQGGILWTLHIVHMFGLGCLRAPSRPEVLWRDSPPRPWGSTLGGGLAGSIRGCLERFSWSQDIKTLNWLPVVRPRARGGHLLYYIVRLGAGGTRFRSLVRGLALLRGYWPGYGGARGLGSLSCAGWVCVV